MPTSPPVTASPTQLFQYRARVTAVYDGDKCTADIDHGLGIWVRGEKLRLHRINSPGLRGADEAKGKAVRDPLVLEFLNLRDEYSEADLEDALIRPLKPSCSNSAATSPSSVASGGFASAAHGIAWTSSSSTATCAASSS